MSWRPNRFGRNGVIVEIEADIDRLGRTNRQNEIGPGRMSGRRQQARLFFGKDLGNGAAVVSGPGALMRDLIAPEQGLTVAFGKVVKERPAQKDSRT